MTSIPISGELPAQFESLRTVIAQNHTEHDELGFQFCVMQHGKPLIDICAGWTDRRRTEDVKDDTLFAVFSSGKAAAALVIAWLVEEDRIGYDQIIDTLWPEFAQAGKAGLTIGQLMSHQAGLSGITNPEWSAKDWFDWEKTIMQLEQQSPIFEPGSASGYHPVTYGFLAGEIARRADKQQRSLGQILREELCQPGDADVWIGLPRSEHGRCSPRRYGRNHRRNPMGVSKAVVVPWRYGHSGLARGRTGRIQLPCDSAGFSDVNAGWRKRTDRRRPYFIRRHPSGFRQITDQRAKSSPSF